MHNNNTQTVAIFDHNSAVLAFARLGTTGVLKLDVLNHAAAKEDIEHVRAIIAEIEKNGAHIFSAEEQGSTRVLMGRTVKPHDQEYADAFADELSNAGFFSRRIDPNLEEFLLVLSAPQITNAQRQEVLADVLNATASDAVLLHDYIQSLKLR